MRILNDFVFVSESFKDKENIHGHLPKLLLDLMNLLAMTIFTEKFVVVFEFLLVVEQLNTVIYVTVRLYR